MRICLLLLSAVLLTGCVAIKPAYFDGHSATYQHPAKRFKHVMEDAAQQCDSVDKLVRHERSDCRFGCISTFTCVTPEDH